MPRLFYTARELGAEMGVSADTVINFEKKGFISPSFRDLNNWRRYTNRHKAELIGLLTGRISHKGADRGLNREKVRRPAPRSQIFIATRKTL